MTFDSQNIQITLTKANSVLFLEHCQHWTAKFCGKVSLSMQAGLLTDVELGSCHSRRQNMPGSNP